MNTPTSPPSALLMMLESRTVFELAGTVVGAPLLRNLPEGDGHPVVVYPGFMATDASTAPLRKFLKKKGYHPHGWDMGRNRGYHPDIEPMLHDRIKNLSSRYGRKVSLVGWSLGGIFAREIGRALPELVRTVITLGSPITKADGANNAKWLFDRMSAQKIEEIDPVVVNRVAEPLPMPSTAVYSRSDGVVAWQCCIDHNPKAHNENVEVYGCHLGLGHNLMSLALIADRLSQPEGDWRPFDASKYPLFPDLEAKRAKKEDSSRHTRQVKTPPPQRDAPHLGRKLTDLEKSLRKLETLITFAGPGK